MRANGFDEVQAVGRLQLDVREHDVGSNGYHGGEGFVRVLRLAANCEIRLALDGFHQTAAHERMVFNDEHANLHAAGTDAIVVRPG